MNEKQIFLFFLLSLSFYTRSVKKLKERGEVLRSQAFAYFED